MKQQNLQTTVEQSIDRAKRAGASAVAASASLMTESDVTWRDGKVESVEQATTRGLSLQLYVDGRYSAVSTSDLRPEALSKFITESVALTRALTPDPHRQLPGASLYANRANLELGIADGSQEKITPDERLRLAQALEAAARSVKGAEKFNSVTANVGDRRAESYRAHSDGFEGSRVETIFSASTSVSVTDSDGRRPSSGSGAARRFRADLPTAEFIGREAAERTLARLGAKKAPSVVLPALVENRTAGTLVGHLLSPLYAQALQQKRSCFDGKLGTKIGSPVMSFRDEPHLVRGIGSRLFDGEGITARRMNVFEGGTLKSFYVDNYYGRKLGMAPTTGRFSNLDWQLGSRDLEALIAQMKDGILITGFLGGNSNSTSGDFSLGVEGFRIRGGKRAEPVAEMNIAGNHLSFWKKLVEVGNDPWGSSAFRTPTLAFDAVQFAGA